MTPLPLTPQSLVADVLERSPDAAALFIAAGTDCVGCAFAHFCTLKEMSIHYGVDLEPFLEELAELEGAD
jgi:hybrid cluster-associated redox disulfide protein